jgi:hypothetical protein
MEHHDGTRYVYCPDCATDARTGRIGPEAPNPGATDTIDSTEDNSMPSGDLL